MKGFLVVSTTFILAFAAPALRAGIGEASVAAAIDAPQRSPLSWESQFRFSLVGASNFTDGPHDLGDVRSLDLRVRAVVSFPVSSNVLLRAGVDWEQTHFDAADSVRIPNSLQGASLVFGADIQLGEAWIFRIEVQPGCYSGGTSLRGDDFNAPITLGASYFVSADLQLVAGVSIDVNRKYPVLPGVGLRWKVAPDWVLNAILPNPRLEYTVSDSFLVYAGAEIRVGTYRMESDFGSGYGDSKLNEAVVDYTQIRAGLGASWQISPSATVELEAGFVPSSELNYHRAEYRIRSDEFPPYGGINVKLKF